MISKMMCLRKDVPLRGNGGAAREVILLTIHALFRAIRADLLLFDRVFWYTQTRMLPEGGILSLSGRNGGCTMKQGKLIRRAVSAALAGCMMFTLSAPALAESTDALMQLSISGNRAASVLDAENSTGDIIIDKKVINPADYDNIVINNKYTFHYDPGQKILTSTSTIRINAITIEVPDDVDVVLDGKENIAVNTLTIKGAHDVTISSDNDPAIGNKAEITCTGKVTIDAPGANFAIGATSSTSDGTLTISGASEVEINAPNSSRILGGFYSKADITCDGPVTIRGNADGGSTLAKSFTSRRTRRMMKTCSSATGK